MQNEEFTYIDPKSCKMRLAVWWKNKRRRYWYETKSHCTRDVHPLGIYAKCFLYA